MKLRKRITAMLICILMVTGMIMGSTVTTSALTFVTGGDLGNTPATVPAIPGYKVQLQFQKYLYAKNGDTSVLDGITKLDVKIKALYYTPADGGAVQPYHYTTSTDYIVSNWPMVNEQIIYNNTETLSGNDETGLWTMTVPLDWGDDSHTYKRIPGVHGARIGNIRHHSSYDKTGTPQDYALVPPGVYTFEVWEDVPASNLITYDPDHYFVDLYVSNILVDGTKETAIIRESDNQYSETCVTNVTVWKGQNLGGKSDSDDGAESGNASDVADGDIVNNKEYDSDSSSPNYTAPGGNWNAEWDSALSYEENIENMKNTNALGKVSSTTEVYTDRDNYLVVTIPFTNAYEKSDLVVSKNVTGNYSNLDEVFTYPVTVSDTSATDTTTWDVEYYVTATDTKVTDQDLINLLAELYPQTGDDPDPEVKSITNKTPANIHLKDGYTFKIRRLSEQATYTISETGVQYYTPSYTMTAGHTAADDAADIVKNEDGNNVTYTVATNDFDAGDSPTITGTAASKGIYTTTAEPNTYIYGTKPDATEGNQLVAAGADDVVITFTNNRDYVTPTGFVMSILPYIGAVVAVLAALVAFLVWKKKRTDQTTGTGL